MHSSSVALNQNIHMNAITIYLYEAAVPVAIRTPPYKELSVHQKLSMALIARTQHRMA